MIYFEQIPHSSLKPFIQNFWYCKADRLSATVLTLPLLHHELVFNFSEYYNIKQLKFDNTFLNPSSWISGLQSKSTLSQSNGKLEMLGVLFKLHGLKAFTKFNCSDFTDFHIESSLVFGSSISILLEQMHNAPNGKSKIEFLEQFLLKRFKDVDYPNHLNRCLSLLSLNNDKVLIKEVCKKGYTTNKTLITSFKKFIGITPNKFLQLRSINAAISLLSQNPELSLTKLSHHLNFYDQSHFIHSFKSVTGLLPSDFAMAVSNRKVEKGSPNFVTVEG